MPLGYLRTGDFRKYSNHLLKLYPQLSRYIKLVRNSLDFTVYELDYCACVAVYKGYSKRVDGVFHPFLTPTSMNNLVSLVAANPEAVHQLSVARTGVAAMRNCILKSAIKYHQIEKNHGEDAMAQSNNIFNDVSVFLCNTDCPLPLPTVLPKLPKREDYVTRIGYLCAAPVGMPILQETCYFCQSPGLFAQSDHICRCSKPNVHYGCFRLLVHQTGSDICCVCRTKCEIPTNKVLDDCKQAKIAGDNYSNIRSSLLKMLRPTHNMKGDPEILVQAYIQLIRDLKIGKPRLKLPDFYNFDVNLPRFETLDMDYPRHSKAGLFFCPRGSTINNRAPTKEEAYTASFLSVMRILSSVLHMYEDGSLTAEQMLEQLPTLWYKIAFKVEALLDDSKQRLFFLPQMEKFLLDKIIFAPVFKRLYNRRYILVGHKWQRGGARRLFDELKGTLPGVLKTHLYWAWDLRRQDQSIKPFHIMMNFMLMLADYDKSDQKLFLLVKFILGWSADNATSSYTKWIGPYSWRVIVGILFSGEYATSISNTIMSAISFLTYLFRVHKYLRSMEDKTLWNEYHEMLEEFIAYIIAKFFGDDGIASIPLALAPILCLDPKLRPHDVPRFIGKGIPTFSQSILEDQGCEIKADASGEYKSLYSIVNRYDQFVYRGPLILKRYFKAVKIHGEPTVVSYRESELFKLFNPTVDVTMPMFQMMRVVGHLWDHHGNNDYMHHVLTQMYHHLKFMVDDDELLKEYRQKYATYLDQGTTGDMKFDRCCKDYLGRVTRSVTSDIDSEEFRQLMLDPFSYPDKDYLREVFNAPIYYNDEKPEDELESHLCWEDIRKSRNDVIYS